MAYWLGFWAFTTMARVQSLVGELRPCKPRGTAKKKKKKSPGMACMAGFSAQSFKRLKSRCWAAFPSGAQGPLSGSLGCGRIQFSVAKGLRLPYPCWLSARGYSQLLEATHIPSPSPKPPMDNFSRINFKSLSLGRALGLLRALLTRSGSPSLVSLS